MKTYVIVLNALVLSLTVFAQSETSGSLSAGIMIAPSVSYRTLGIPMNDPVYDIESAKIVYKAGAPILYNTSNRFSVESGLFFSTMGEQTLFYSLTYYNGTTFIDSGKAKFIYLYRYLDLPVKANYYFVKKESGSGLYLTGGGSFSFFIGHIQKYFYDVNGKETKYRENRSRDADFYPVIISWQLGIGWEKAFNDELRMRIASEFQKNLMPIANEPVKRYFYSVGLQLSLLRNL